MDGEVAHHEPTEGGCSGTHTQLQPRVFTPPLALHQDAFAIGGLDTLITIGDQK
jgi:hypothetical protein